MEHVSFLMEVSQLLPSDVTSLTQLLPSLVEPNSLHIVTRSQTGKSKPKEYSCFQMYYSTKHPLKALTAFHQASSYPNWMAAMESEFQALPDNHTWTLCPRPNNRNVIHNKWIYKLKQKLDRSIERYKARLVTKRI